jgi:hypothetical protein
MCPIKPGKVWRKMRRRAVLKIASISAIVATVSGEFAGWRELDGELGKNGITDYAA